MTEPTQSTAYKSDDAAAPLRVRLPGFIREEDIGLGDAITRVAYAFGIKACGGCDQRASMLNRRVVLTR